MRSHATYLTLACVLSSLCCAQEAVGRTLNQIPAPDFYFPLQFKDLSSTNPDENLTAVASPGLEWVDDPVFGTVIDCDADLNTFVKIPGIKYGQSGSFAVSFWLKVRENTGSDLNYAYSHIGPAGAEIEDATSEVHLYLPEQAHPHYGVLRSIVRDSSDGKQDASDPTYLDSDGCVVDPDCVPFDATTTIDPADGKWHFVVLSTLPGRGEKGYAMFVDGQEAGKIVEGESYVTDSGNIHVATGGNPMKLDGDLHLCTRADESEERFFSGSITQLKVWNKALSGDQVAEFYAEDPFAAALSNALESDSMWPRGVTDEGECQSPCTEYEGEMACLSISGELLRCNLSFVDSSNATRDFVESGLYSPFTVQSDEFLNYEMAEDCFSPCENVNGLIGCYTSTGELRGCTLKQDVVSETGSLGRTIDAPSTKISVSEESSTEVNAVRIDGHPLCSSMVIPGLATVSECSQGYVCFPLSHKRLEEELGTATPSEEALGGPGKIGLCVYSPAEILLPDPSKVPPADAFFPLSSRSIESYPLSKYKSLNAGSSIAEDPIFGYALRCNADEKDAIAIDPVPYGSNGSFAINIWARPQNMSGSNFAYLFSHRNTEKFGENSIGDHGFGPNQVQLLLPEQDHPSFGIARTFVKDGNDFYQGEASEAYVDSDGQLSFNGERQPPYQIFDNQWHMFTLTSQPDGSSGYRLYVDGKLAGGMNTSVVPVSSDSGVEFHVDGGDPMEIDGDIALCTRSYDNAVRHFDGDLAYLSIWDHALNAKQVSYLYEAVLEKVLTADSPVQRSGYDGELSISTRSDGNAVRYGVGGRPCIFPSFRDGIAHQDCVFVGEIPMCVVDKVADSWDECYLTDEEWNELASKNDELSPFQISSSVSNNELVFDDASSTLSSVSSDNDVQCVFPLTYSGFSVSRCVSIQGEHMCWTESSGEPQIADSENPYQTARNRPQSVLQLGSWTSCSIESTIDGPDPAALNDFGSDASDATVLAIERKERYTSSGYKCELPIVVNGEIIDDCVEKSGLGMACITSYSNGTWEQCDEELRYSIQNTAPSVAQRQTIYGKSCLLPAVWDGSLHFDCAKYGDVDSLGSIRNTCPSEEGVWELCAPIEEGQEMVYKKFKTEDVLDRAQPGNLGQLCSIEPSQSSDSHNCAEDLICVPLPDFGEKKYNASITMFDGIGFCATKPIGGTFGIFKSLDLNDAPQPLAYMPFTGGSFDSLTLPRYKGHISNSNGIMWHPDPMFDMVPICSRADGTVVHLDKVPYASNGSFAVNLWMRRLGYSDVSGDAFQYLFHHTSNTTYSPGLTPNQISIYLTSKDHPAYPAVRALVRDSNDVLSDLLWLDSDGYVANNSNRSTEELPPGMVDVNDGQWHMITLSTLEDDSPGYALYVDGELAGMLHGDVRQEDGSPTVATGGDPTYLDDDIVLCARVDTSSLPSDDRYFDGTLTNVALWGSALSPAQVKALYSTYNPTEYAAAVKKQYQEIENGSETELQSQQSTEEEGDGMSSALIAGIVFASVGGFAALVGLSVFVASYIRKKRSQKRFQRFDDGTDRHDSNGFSGNGNLKPSFSLGNEHPTDGTFSVQLTNGSSKKLGESKSASVSAIESKYLQRGSSTNGGSFTAGNQRTESMASHTTMTDDVEIDTGKRSLFGKSETRIVIPEDMAP